MDCCCPSQKLVIEEYGDSHYLSKLAREKDLSRQKFIEDLGFRVLRFTNKEISENINGVLEVITKYLNNNLT